MRPTFLLLAASLFAAGFLAACGNKQSRDHPIRPGETITLDHPITIQGHTITRVLIATNVRTTQP